VAVIVDIRQHRRAEDMRIDEHEVALVEPAASAIVTITVIEAAEFSRRPIIGVPDFVRT
jgi:uncharacterized cupredoxin-like copper-binding protein